MFQNKQLNYKTSTGWPISNRTANISLLTRKTRSEIFETIISIFAYNLRILKLCLKFQYLLLNRNYEEKPMVPENAISPHLIFWFEACPDFTFQYILMKIDKNLTNTIGCNISKAFFYVLKNKKSCIEFSQREKWCI